MFDYVEERLESAALDLTYHLTPWDEAVFGAPTAAISSMKLKRQSEAGDAYAPFRDWCMRSSISLVSCRLRQDELAECGFLESRGFRFIELNYRPTLSRLNGFADDPEIDIRQAEPEDETQIAAFAGEIFDTGRLHVDPQVGPEIGNRRYRAWAANAFRHPGQQVMKCCMDGRTVAFMVVEQTSPTNRFWSLVGLAPGLQGQGLGRRVWRAMLGFHRGEGVTEVSTSISSHNVAVQNLYVSLGFRFPAPSITLHWCPFGPLKTAAP
jgi:ribosomal protein S18 acetylase RimI-like enzyme